MCCRGNVQLSGSLQKGHRRVQEMHLHIRIQTSLRYWWQNLLECMPVGMRSKMWLKWVFFQNLYCVMTYNDLCSAQIQCLKQYSSFLKILLFESSIKQGENTCCNPFLLCQNLRTQEAISLPTFHHKKICVSNSFGERSKILLEMCLHN